MKTDIRADIRGSMNILFENRKFETHILKMTISKRGVLRGFHYQPKPLEQSKLIIVLEGTIQDVCYNMTNDETSFHDVILGEDEKYNALMIPKSFAHAYLTLSDYSRVLYLCDQKYGGEISINPQRKYKKWIFEHKNMIISEKDLQND